MITELEVENFKAFGMKQRARFARITLIYGGNSSGKSTLIQSLLLLKQSMELSRSAFERRIVPRGHLVDLGDSLSLMYRRIPNAQPRIRVGFTLSEHEGDDPLPVTGANVAISFGRSGIIEQVEYGPEGWRPWRVLKDGRLADEQSADAIVEYLKYVGTQPRRGIELPKRPSSPTDFSLLRGCLRDSRIVLRPSNWLPDRLDEELDTLFDSNFPLREALKDLNRGLRRLSGAFAEELESLRYLGPVRARPSRYQEGARGPDLHEDTFGQLLFEQVARLHAKPSGEKILNEWIRAFEIPYEFKVRDLGDAMVGRLLALGVTDVRAGLEVTLPDIGYGVSQLLPVIVIGIAGSGNIIVVEQPELHLHPRQQGHLSDFMNASIRQPEYEADIEDEAPSRPTQWIVETHSEAIVSRFQRRIREGKLASTDIAVIFVEPGPDGARLRELRLDERGEFIDEWPGGFFEETYWDLFGGTQ